MDPCRCRSSTNSRHGIHSVLCHAVKLYFSLSAAIITQSTTVYKVQLCYKQPSKDSSASNNLLYHIYTIHHRTESSVHTIHNCTKISASNTVLHELKALLRTIHICAESSGSHSAVLLHTVERSAAHSTALHRQMFCSHNTALHRKLCFTSYSTAWRSLLHTVLHSIQSSAAHSTLVFPVEICQYSTELHRTILHTAKH